MPGGVTQLHLGGDAVGLQELVQVLKEWDQGVKVKVRGKSGVLEGKSAKVKVHGKADMLKVRVQRSKCMVKQAKVKGVTVCHS